MVFNSLGAAIYVDEVSAREPDELQLIHRAVRDSLLKQPYLKLLMPQVSKNSRLTVRQSGWGVVLSELKIC